MQPIISVTNLSKTYASGFRALNNVSLDIRRGEIFALLGPNGAGKTTLINIICGIVTPSEGKILADGHDIITDYRAARAKIGLVPQELTTDAFASVGLSYREIAEIAQCPTGTVMSRLWRGRKFLRQALGTYAYCEHERPELLGEAVSASRRHEP